MGFGITAEGVEQNPVVYELAALTSQSEKGVDVDWFLADYSRRRYGGYSVRQPAPTTLPVGTGQGAFLAGFIVGNNPIAGSPGYLGPGEWYDPAKHGEMGKEEAYDRAREAWEILGKTVYGARAKGEDEDHVRDACSWQPSLRADELSPDYLTPPRLWTTRSSPSSTRRPRCGLTARGRAWTTTSWTWGGSCSPGSRTSSRRRSGIPSTPTTPPRLRCTARRCWSCSTTWMRFSGRTKGSSSVTTSSPPSPGRVNAIRSRMRQTWSDPRVLSSPVRPLGFQARRALGHPMHDYSNRQWSGMLGRVGEGDQGLYYRRWSAFLRRVVTTIEKAEEKEKKNAKVAKMARKSSLRRRSS